MPEPWSEESCGPPCLYVLRLSVLLYTNLSKAELLLTCLKQVTLPKTLHILQIMLRSLPPLDNSLHLRQYDSTKAHLLWSSAFSHLLYHKLNELSPACQLRSLGRHQTLVVPF